VPTEKFEVSNVLAGVWQR